jgi:hypothetical protein
MARTSNTVDLLRASLGSADAKTSTVGARLVNVGSVKIAKLGAAFAASSDNFGKHFELERKTLKVLADQEFERELARCAARIDAALAN